MRYRVISSICASKADRFFGELPTSCGKDRHWLRNTTKAKATKRVDGLFDKVGHRLRQEQPAARRLRYWFEPRGDVHGRTHDGEIKAIARADIAIKDGAAVQGDPQAQGSPFCLYPESVARLAIEHPYKRERVAVDDLTGFLPSMQAFCT